MERNLLDISKSLLENIEKIDNLVDEYFAPIKDYADTASDIFTPIKAIYGLYTANKKRKFKTFLKAYSQNLAAENFENAVSTEKLKQYLKNEKNFNFLNEVIDNAINSKSIYGSLILGYYAGQIISNQQIITFKDIIIIEALKSLSDFEFACIARIFHVADTGVEEINIRSYESLTEILFFCELTIDRLVQLRIIEKSKREGMYDWIRIFRSTDLVEDIFVYIESTNILQELLKYKF